MLKKYSKIIMISLICFSIICSNSFVSAKENDTYYTNNNGVSLTKAEYDFFTKMYWDGYQKNITEEEYQKIIESNVMNGEFKTKSIVVNENNRLTRGTIHATSAKRLQIAASCDEECVIATTLTWLGQPTVRSYDVMGAVLAGVELVGTPLTRVSSDTTYFFADNVKYDDEGFGVSFQLPSTGGNIIINQTFYTTPGGHIYASYQHAMEDTTLEVSEDYTISLLGFGRVFEFDSGYEIYDRMNGVDIEV